MNSHKPENEAKLAALLQQASKLQSPNEQAEFLHHSCAGRPRLRDRLQAILAAMPVDGDGEAKETNLGEADKDSPPSPPDSGERSVLYSLAAGIRPPSVVLDDSIAEDAEPILQPTSTEMPKTIESSRYQLQGEIARGGMGAVLKGRDVDLGRNLAIKVLLDEHKNNPLVVQRFIEESQIGGQLQHPGVAPVYELGQFEDQRPFFTMKLVKGETLAYMLAGPATVKRNRAKLLGIFEQVCQTMAYAHSRRVIHRDLKPANIMVGAFGEVQVMDWGLAKVLDAEGKPPNSPARQPQNGNSIIATFRSAGSDVPLPNVGSVKPIGSATQMGNAMGTPAYMPPEQALGEVDRMDRRSDVFGLGAILCEMLTGQPPYIAADVASMMRMARRGKTDECFVRLDQSDADEQLIQLTKRCLALELDERPSDAAEVSELVTRYLQSVEAKVKEVEIRRAEEAARSAEERKRRKVIVGLAGSVLLTIGLGVWWWVWNSRQVAEGKLASQQQFDLVFSDAELHRRLADNEDLTVREFELGLAIDGAQAAMKLGTELKLSQTAVRPAEALSEQLEKELEQTKKAIATHGRNQRLQDQLQLIRVRNVSVGEENVLAETSNASRLDRANKSYQSAFAAAGIDLTKLSDQQIVQRLRNSPIRRDIIESMDHWISCFPKQLGPNVTKASQHSPELQQRRRTLGRLLQQVDDNAYRRSIRKAADSDVAQALQLVQDEESKRQNDGGAAWLGAVLRRAGEVDSAIEVLRASQLKTPEDWRLNLELALCFQVQGNAAESLNYARAAYAARPNSKASQWVLMTILAAVGRTSESERLQARML